MPSLARWNRSSFHALAHGERPLFEAVLFVAPEEASTSRHVGIGPAPIARKLPEKSHRIVLD